MKFNPSEMFKKVPKFGVSGLKIYAVLDIHSANYNSDSMIHGTESGYYISVNLIDIEEKDFVEYETYNENEYEKYTEDVYASCSDGSIITKHVRGDDGKVCKKPILLHREGEPKFDEEGNFIYIHRAGDFKLDKKGNKIKLKTSECKNSHNCYMKYDVKAETFSMHNYSYTTHFDDMVFVDSLKEACQIVTDKCNDSISHYKEEIKKSKSHINTAKDIQDRGLGKLEIYSMRNKSKIRAYDMLKKTKYFVGPNSTKVDDVKVIGISKADHWRNDAEKVVSTSNNAKFEYKRGKFLPIEHKDYNYKLKDDDVGYTTITYSYLFSDKLEAEEQLKQIISDRVKAAKKVLDDETKLKNASTRKIRELTKDRK